MYLCLEWDNASASLEASTEVKGSPRTSSVPGEVLTPPPSLGTCSVSATDTDLIMCFFLSTQFHQEGQDSSVFPSCYELESLRLYIFFFWSHLAPLAFSWHLYTEPSETHGTSAETPNPQFLLWMSFTFLFFLQMVSWWRCFPAALASGAFPCVPVSPGLEVGWRHCSVLLSVPFFSLP